jgi:flagellar operon protein
MVDKVTSSSLSPIGDVGREASRTRSQRVASDGSSFEEILKAQLGRDPSVRFSAHAQRRIEARQIDFGGDEAARLEQAVDRAAKKSSRDSLVLMDDVAFVVDVKNRLVVTAMDAASRKEDVFTNIDSVVLI